MQLTEDGLFAVAATIVAAQIAGTGQKVSRNDLTKLLAQSIEAVTATHQAYGRRTTPGGKTKWEALAN